jgi:hypothetical protein
MDIKMDIIKRLLVFIYLSYNIFITRTRDKRW